MTDSNEDPSANGDDRRPQENVYREIHDWTSTEPLSSTILTALADVKNVEPTELEPLYEHIDPDALESLFDPDGDGLRTDGHVSFSFADHYVTIHGHGEYAVISLVKSRRSLSIFRGGDEKNRQRSCLRVSPPAPRPNGSAKRRSSNWWMGRTESIGRIS